MAGMLDREWAYVACSRSRFATTLYADASSLGLVDLESHRSSELAPKSRADALDALASRMRRSRAKGTTLDYDDAPDIRPEQELHGSDISRPAPALGARMVSAARRLMASLAAKRAMAVERGHGSGGARQGGLETEREQEQERAR
jgi:hypothetical protein